MTLVEVAILVAGGVALTAIVSVAKDVSKIEAHLREIAELLSSK
jgi:hypothetical protein